MPQAPTLIYDIPFNAVANVVYALPSYPVFLAYQSTVGVNLNTSNDGTNFSLTDSASANEARSIQLAQVFVKFTQNTVVVAKKAFMAVYQPPVGGSSGGGGAAIFTRGLFGDGTQTAPSISFQNEQATGFYRVATGYLGFAGQGVAGFAVNNSNLFFNSGFGLNWTSGTPVSAVDLTLVRDGAGALAQRDGTNPQSSRVYNTFTNASNYERLTTSWATGIAVFGTEQAGSGLARAMSFMVGGTQVWQINTSGHLIALLDNARDIGAAGATRPKNIYVASSLVSKVKAGTPTDSDVSNPADGMMVLDSTANKIWVRLGGTWKGVVVA